jgi:dTDP-4-amino-4,6-dideoxy-D-galactose acyltransferase
MPGRVAPSEGPGLLRPLAWDSGHFGFPVSRLTRPRLSESQLAAALRLARQQGTRLVYWPAHPEQPVPAALLGEYGGLLADRKVTYHTTLASEEEPGGCGPSGLVIRPYPKGAATAVLVELAVAAGEHSRFRVDRRIPSNKYASLYEIWMQRSTRHELADAVLVAVGADRPDDILGMITLSETEGTGHIGLVAVAAAARGRGVGSRLLRAAHGWMLGRGATRARVVTQLANGPACRLYERAGYTVLDIEHLYHFWPQAPAAKGTERT